MALKACISKLFKPDVIPNKALVNSIYTHSLKKLLNLANLLPQFEEYSKADAEFAANWGIVSKWSEQSRYEFNDEVAAASLIESISDPNHGVFQWVKQDW